MVLGGEKSFQYKCKIEEAYIFSKDKGPFRNNHR